MKKSATILFRTFALLFAGALLGQWLTGNNPFSTQMPFSPADKVSKVLKLVKENYVDTLNTDSLEGETVNNLLQKLDPHSLYLPPLKATSIRDRLEGGFKGLGIEFLLYNDTIFVSRVYAGSPAALAGIKPGNRVISLNNNSLTGKHFTDDSVRRLFAANNDKQFAIKVLNNGKLQSISIKPGTVALSSIDAAYMCTPQTGYIKISKFAANTDRDFKLALQNLKAQGMRQLVIDLRDNGGGYLNAATALADEFLPAKKLIVYTKGAHEPRTDYFATDSGAFEKGKLAIIINEYSASASEILAGAIQDLDRGIIVGRRSFGKGLVQQQFEFDDGSAINLTVARYYTPSGRCIQKSYADGLDNYNNELAERMQKGELFSAKNNMDDSIFKSAPKFHTERGRVVYSSGGIMPDIFVPEDTAGNTDLLASMYDKQLFTAFAIEKLLPGLNRYPTFENFDKNFNVTDDMLTSFLIFASSSIKEMNTDDVRQSKTKIALLLKAYTARVKWGDEAFVKVLNKNDTALLCAAKAL